MRSHVVPCLVSVREIENFQKFEVLLPINRNISTRFNCQESCVSLRTVSISLSQRIVSCQRIGFLHFPHTHFENTQRVSSIRRLGLFKFRGTLFTFGKEQSILTAFLPLTSLLKRVREFFGYVP